MTAQAWLARYYSRGDCGFPYPLSVAAEIIRAQQERIERLTAELKEREGEVGRIRKTYDSQMDILRKRVESLLLDKEFLTSNVNHAESLAASLLTDQEAIERHVTKRVAGECADFLVNYDMNNFPGSLTSGISLREWLARAIRQKYGVE